MDAGLDVPFAFHALLQIESVLNVWLFYCAYFWLCPMAPPMLIPS
jgi:hypothetical protein